MTSLTKLQKAFFKKAKEFDKVKKMGRTHLQDAVPMSLGAEFHGWGTTGEDQRIAEVRQFLHDQPGRDRHRHHRHGRARLSELSTKYLSEVTGFKFILAGDLVRGDLRLPAPTSCSRVC